MNIKEIAKLCGVSASTVSKVINHKDEEISGETRKKVMDVVAQYQYVPFEGHQKKRAPHRNLIGIITGKRSKGLPHIVNSIEKCASDHGYSVMLANTCGEKREIARQIRIMEGKGADGVILTDYQEGAKELAKLPVLHILTDEGPPEMLKEPCIYCSLEEAGYLAAQELIEKGHMKIGCLLSKDDEPVEKGYFRALYDNNIPINLSRIEKGCNMEEIVEFGILEGVSLEATAYLCGNSDIACCLYKTLKERGQLVPDEVSVVCACYDHMSDILSPKLTSAVLPYREMGEKAFLMMQELIEKGAGIGTVKVPVRMKEKNSIVTPRPSSQGKRILVVGSINQDILMYVPQIPTEGETLLAKSLVLLPGGKGANQAACAGKLGGTVYLVGKLGADTEGKSLYSALLKNNVKMDGVSFETGLDTGKAYVTVADNGDSTITVYQGANQYVESSYLKNQEKLFETAYFCLLSLEIPGDAAEYTLKLCQKHHVRPLVKPSSVQKIPEQWYKMIEYFIPNEKEMKTLVPYGDSIEEKADYLFQKGIPNIIVTLGKKGCYLKNAEYAMHLPAADFETIDSTGAADIFIATLAVFLSEESPLVISIGYAAYAAGLSVTRYGVQNGIPERAALEVYQEEIRKKFVFEVKE